MSANKHTHEIRSAGSQSEELAALLDEVENEIRKYVFTSKPAIQAIALWIAHTWCFDAATVSPRLRLDSAVPGCGKTTVISVIQHLVKEPLPLSNVTAPVIYRVISQARPTLLMDEADTYLAKGELQGILNSGHNKSGAHVLRVDPKTGDVVKFSTWAPVVIAGLGRFTDPLESRCIRIMLQRRLPTEKLSHFVESAETLSAFRQLAERLERWASANVAALSAHSPAFPSELSNRDSDNWRAMFAIADFASPQWGERARLAAVHLTGAAADLHEAPLELLLADIRDVFEKANAPALPSKTIVDALKSLPDRPWSTWKSRLGLSANDLARFLRPLGIQSLTIRSNGTTMKGYYRKSFEDAFLRYCPKQSESKA